MEPIRLVVCRDDDPGILVDRCLEIMKKLGLCVTVESEGEDSCIYIISASTEV